MFTVTLSSDTKEFISSEAARAGFAQPCLIVSRQGPKGDVARAPDGQARWSIERPHPWRADVTDARDFGETPPDVTYFDGVRVWLALIPRAAEKGVHVSLRNGELWLEPQ